MPKEKRSRMTVERVDIREKRNSPTFEKQEEKLRRFIEKKKCGFVTEAGAFLLSPSHKV